MGEPPIIPAPGERWHHVVYGIVTVVENRGNEIELRNEAGEWRLAIGWVDQEAMLRRMGKRKSR